MQLSIKRFNSTLIGAEPVSSKRLAVLSASFLSIVIFLVYFPSLSTGFFAQDYDFLEPAARWDLTRYLLYYIDPRAQVLWYRPLQGLQILLEYRIFGANAMPYHVIQIALHVLNCLLLMGIVWRVSGKWRLGFFTAFLYATFPVYALAVNWINITDPLATILYLLGIWFWLDYLETDERRPFGLTLLVFAFALLTKQMAVTLPAILLLLDRLLIQKPARLDQIIRRYSLFVLVAGVFASAQYVARSTHVFAGVFGYSISSQVVSIFIQYLSLLVFPWGYYPPTDTQITEGFPFADTGNLVWLALAIGIFFFITITRKSRALVFIGSALVISLLPVLPFPFVELRYLYLPAMFSAILLALLFDRAWTWHLKWMRAFTIFAFILLFVGNSFSISNANAGIFEIARQRRVPFRDISSQHPTFPEDTHLYFIDTISPLPELSGMFTLRYGPSVTVGGNTAEQVTRLRDHKNTFVYFFDESSKPHEVAVEVDPRVKSSLSLPASLDAPIVLNGFEFARTRVKRGDVMIALFDWHATNVIDKNYTVFMHLVDKDGRMRAGYDSPPSKGEAPTSRWLPYRPMVDAIVMPIPTDIPVGDDYRIEVGMYYFPTQQRLMFVDGRGQPLADQLVIAPFSILE